MFFRLFLHLLHSILFIRNVVKIWLVHVFSFCSVVSYFSWLILYSRFLSQKGQIALFSYRVSNLRQDLIWSPIMTWIFGFILKIATKPESWDYGQFCFLVCNAFLASFVSYPSGRWLVRSLSFWYFWLVPKCVSYKRFLYIILSVVPSARYKVGSRQSFSFLMERNSLRGRGWASLLPKKLGK